MTVQVRKIERDTYETGPAGGSTRTDTHYELGDEIGGVWVPFASVSEGRVADFAQRAEREAEAAKAAKAAGKPNGST
jgi:hypothetical protein